MASTNSHSILPISGLEKIGDLLSFGGPVLSLFQDDNGRHHLFYWVDYGESFNRWLVWKVQDEDLYNYLLGEISLYDLIVNQNNHYVFSVDIDEQINYSNLVPYEVRSIPADYLPEKYSYYKLPVPALVQPFIKEYEQTENHYNLLMKSRAIIFNISPSTPTYLSAITTSDAGSFLSRLSKSISAYVEETFWARFKDNINSSTDFNRIISQVKEIMAPRVFGLRYGSFEVEVGVDTVHKVPVDSFSEWQTTLLPEYRKDVVEIDYNNVEQLHAIANKYPESAREKIYEPYIKIINSTKYSFVVKDKANNIVHQYKKVEKQKENIVIPQKERLQIDLPKGKKFVNIVVEMTEGQDVGEINKKLLQSGLIFSQELQELNLELGYVENGFIRLIFKAPVNYTLSIRNNVYNVYVEDVNLYLEDTNKDVLITHLQSELIRIYNATKDLTDYDAIKAFFERIISKVEYLTT